MRWPIHAGHHYVGKQKVNIACISPGKLQRFLAVGRQKYRISGPNQDCINLKTALGPPEIFVTAHSHSRLGSVLILLSGARQRAQSAVNLETAFGAAFEVKTRAGRYRLLTRAAQ